MQSLTYTLEGSLWPLCGEKGHLLQLVTVAESKGERMVAWTRVRAVEVVSSDHILGIGKQSGQDLLLNRK